MWFSWFYCSLVLGQDGLVADMQVKHMFDQFILIQH